MNECLVELKPPSLWSHFREILSLPRCSGEEKAIGDYIIKRAKALGLEHKRDEAGNVVVYKPAKLGLGTQKTIVLQAHLDMVCEKDSEISHDFSKDPIEAELEGDWLRAKGTTLGADNGIGVAAALAIMESQDIIHGPLEFLFTVEEETGLRGASELQADFIRGRILLNLDSEEEGTFTIGCSGGGDSEIFFPLQRLEGQTGTLIELKISGLRGGHSGLDIHLGLANAIKLLARLLHMARGELPLSLIHIEGGTKRNAIPREAWAHLICDASHYSDVVKFFEREFEVIKKEYKVTEPEARVSIRQVAETREEPLAPRSTRNLINLLMALPHGVLSWHQEIPDLVETSTNMAIIKTEGNVAKMVCSSRSSVKSALQATRSMIRAIAEMAGAEVKESGGYPGWEPNLASPLLQLAKRVYHSVFGQEPRLKAVHAGLECGVIAEKFPGMEMISFGPTIKFPHSPQEKVHVPSVEKFWLFLVALLEELAREKSLSSA